MQSLPKGDATRAGKSSFFFKKDLTQNCMKLFLSRNATFMYFLTALTKGSILAFVKNLRKKNKFNL
jgi:hypothetical protein